MAQHATAEAIADGISFDPFGAIPNWASRISGLGGSDPAMEPGYVFRTEPLRVGSGTATFLVTFHDLSGTCGTVRLEAIGISPFPGVEAGVTERVDLSVADIVGAGGMVELDVVTRRDSLYQLAATVDGATDIASSGITIAIHRNAVTEPHRAAVLPAHVVRSQAPRRDPRFIRSWMTSLDAPSFDDPTSQGWTPRQARSDVFAALTEELGLGHVSPMEAWREAFVLRCLDAYGVDPEPSGIGFAAAPGSLGAAAVRRGHMVLLARHREVEEPAEADALAGNEAERSAADSARARDVHQMSCNWWSLPRSLLHHFDYLWSVGADSILERDKFFHFVLSSLECLRPGGLAVHMFDLSHGGDSPAAAGAGGLSRPFVERLVAHALSHLNDVAVLRFRGLKSTEEGRMTSPFGLILRRGRPR